MSVPTIQREIGGVHESKAVVRYSSQLPQHDRTGTNPKTTTSQVVIVKLLAAQRGKLYDRMSGVKTWWIPKIDPVI